MGQTIYAHCSNFHDKKQEKTYQVRDEGDLSKEGIQDDGVRVGVHLALLDRVGVVVGVADVRLRLGKHAPTCNRTE